MRFTGIILATVIVAQFSCGSSTNDCNIDAQLETEFRNCLAIAESIVNEEYGIDGFDTEQESKFIESLEVLTKHKSRVQINHGIVWYESRGDYTVDSVAWNSWYENNKCILTIEMVADTFDKYREPLPDYTDAKVLRNAQDKYPQNVRDSVRYLDSMLHVKFQLDWPRQLTTAGQGASR